jgi:hypothetical protein
MATRSTIALEYADGTIGQIYCHWDGYLEHNGSILFKHYVDPFKTRELMDLGDLSSLRPTIGEKHAFSQFDLPKEDVEAFVNLTRDMCTFYGRDRGETGTTAKSFKDYADYEQNLQHEEYAYILRKDGYWYVKAHEGAFELLRDALANCKEEEMA